jgi:hypothetical protein
MVPTHMLQVSGSGELKPALALSHRLHVAFPTVVQGRRSRGVISEINTAPVRPSANASPRHRWSSTHSLRPKRVASPYFVMDFHLLHHAGFDRRFHNVPLAIPQRVRTGARFTITQPFLPSFAAIDSVRRVIGSHVRIPALFSSSFRDYKQVHFASIPRFIPQGGRDLL